MRVNQIRKQNAISKDDFKKLTSKNGNKYNAQSKKYDGYTYHSIKEANYAAQLDLMKKTRGPFKIKRWERQVKLELRVNDVHITNYFIDFKVYFSDGSIEYVEVKGFETNEWRLKWRITQALWPNKIQGVERKAKLVLVK